MRKILICLFLISFFMTLKVDAKYIRTNTAIAFKVQNIDSKLPSINGRNYSVYDEEFESEITINYEDNLKVKYAKYFFDDEEGIDFETGKIFNEPGKYRVEVCDFYGNIVEYTFSIKEKIEPLTLNIISEELLETKLFLNAKNCDISKIEVFLDDTFYKEFEINSNIILEEFIVTNEFYQEVYAVYYDYLGNSYQTETLILNSDKIYSENDMYEFASMLNSGEYDSKEKTIYLMNDIEKLDSWTPINSFEGIFDAQSHSIFNFSFNSRLSKTGLFISNLRNY